MPWAKVSVFLSFLSVTIFLPYSEAIEPDWDLLNQGEIQIAVEPFEAVEGSKKRAVAMVVLPVGIDAAWKVLHNWDAMGKYVPNLKYYRTVYQSDTEKYIAGRLRILFINIDYPLLVLINHDKSEHTWRLLTKDELLEVEKQGIKGLLPAHFLIKNVNGNWKLTPIDANHTLLRHSTLLSTKMPIPQAVEIYIIKLTLPNFIAAVRQRLIELDQTE